MRRQYLSCPQEAKYFVGMPWRTGVARDYAQLNCRMTCCHTTKRTADTWAPPVSQVSPHNHGGSDGDAKCSWRQRLLSSHYTVGTRSLATRPCSKSVSQRPIFGELTASVWCQSKNVIGSLKKEDKVRGGDFQGSIHRHGPQARGTEDL